MAQLTKETIDQSFSNTFQNNEEIIELVDNKKYDEALNKLTDIDERNLLTMKALSDIYGNNKKFVNFYEEAIHPLIHIFEELGFNKDRNPFVTFLNRVNYAFKDNLLNKKNIIRLNNWYSDDLIDANDLKGLSQDGKQHIIYNPNFYTLDDPEKILMAYNFLGDSYRLNRLNYNAILQSNRLSDGRRSTGIKNMAKKILNGEIKIDNSTAPLIRDAFMTTDGTTTESGKLRNYVNDLETLLNIANSEYGSSSGTMQKNTKNRQKDASDNIRAISSKEDKVNAIANIAKENNLAKEVVDKLRG